jgi:hypothetical protein
MIDTCIVCSWPVALHFQNGRAVSCAEVQIQVSSSKLPAYPRGWDGCTRATQEGNAEAKRIERRQRVDS